MKRSVLAAARLTAAVATIALFAKPASALEFQGYDPETFDGEMLPADALKAMVEAARKVNPPKNGETYVIGFANLQRDIPFCVLVEQGIEKNAEAAGIELLIADNRLDGATALTNAESFINREVDYVIEFQTDANFGETIMRKLDEADTGVTAIDIPMPGATFFGVNNPRAGFMGGSYLAQAAIAEFGEDVVKEGYFIEGELPQSGPIPAMRTGGQMAGFLASVPGFDESHVLTFDSKNTLEESFTRTNSLLGRIPEGVPVMGTAINDQASAGILRAIQQGGREEGVVVGLGADDIETLVREADFVASVGSFPERYGNSLVPIALASLAGEDVPEAVLINHQMVTPQNVCEFYPEFECADGEAVDYQFPQAAFEAHLESLASDASLDDVRDLVPTE